jgi:HAE1 family hydrophobic/amphiphilic exporter-1
MAITASTLTTIAVFVPVLFMGGIAAQTFQQLAWVVSFALLCSLIISITVVPVLCARFLRASGATKKTGLGARLGAVQEGWSESYGRLVGWALDHRMPVVLTAVLLFASSLYMIPLIGVELEPQLDEGTIEVNIELPPGTRVEVTDEEVQKMAAVVKEVVPEAKYIMTEAGSSSTFRFRGVNT